MAVVWAGGAGVALIAGAEGGGPGRMTDDAGGCGLGKGCAGGNGAGGAGLTGGG
ncbi:hypothetical protein [Immundisolibacter sp.]